MHQIGSLLQTWSTRTDQPGPKSGKSIAPPTQDDIQGFCGLRMAESWWAKGVDWQEMCEDLGYDFVRQPQDWGLVRIGALLHYCFLDRAVMQQGNAQEPKTGLQYRRREHDSLQVRGALCPE
jgi:hypothetical protein